MFNLINLTTQYKVIYVRVEVKIGLYRGLQGGALMLNGTI